MKAHVAVIAGDGIGPEVTAEAVRVLEAVASRAHHSIRLSPAPFGGVAIDECGDPLPEATLNLCLQADAVLLGAIGGPKWSSPQAKVRPEQGLLKLRKSMGVYANLRPVSVHPALREASTLKPEVLEGVDMVFVRELTGGIYFGDKQRTATSASDVCLYTVAKIERIVRVAARLASARSGRLHSIDKANVLETSRLWRRVVTRVAAEYPDVELDHLLVDNAAMQLVRRPRDFCVIVTENMFGDILSDEAAILTGSIGTLPSASLGTRRDGKFGLFEPIGGSAPDIAGRGVANPTASILSAALLLRHALDDEENAARVESAVERVYAGGTRTAELVARG